MTRSWVSLLLSLTGWIFASHVTYSLAEESPPPGVNVGVYARHQAGKIMYHYRVINNFPQTIDAVTIGRDSRNDEDANNDAWELRERPSGWHAKLGIPAASSSSPTGWKVSLDSPEKSNAHAVIWETVNSKSPALLGDQTLTKLSVSLDKPDANYLNSHAMVHFTNRYPATLTVPLEQLDTTPPGLSVNFSPSTLFPPDGKLVPTNAIFTVKDDDYDRLPEIKLEFITANEPLEPGDFRDASFGIDDRHIKLRARHSGSSDRIYTVVYSATDASGNQTLASANVTVTYDQGAGANPERTPD